MARPDEIQIRLVGTDDRLKMRSVLSAIKAALDALDNINRDEPRVEWLIDHASMSSPFSAVLRPTDEDVSDPALRKVNRYFEGIRWIEKHRMLPEGWTAKAAQATHRLAKYTSNGLHQVSLTSPQYGTVEPSVSIVENLVAAVERASASYSEWTTLQGSLDDVLAHGQVQIRIYDAITGDPIRCVFADEEDLEKIKAALKKRVTVYGLALFKKGRPESIKVKTFQQIPGDLPLAADLKPVDITGDEDSVDYVRRGRDEGEE